ncbi:MAG TPA: hypothetical protein VFV92_00535, partial [Candidatus Bathyarchaeia archaeon]|nr:hypothetical protein [Candidatus Bathyarchaeia archaeon]
REGMTPQSSKPRKGRRQAIAGNMPGRRGARLLFWAAPSWNRLALVPGDRFSGRTGDPHCLFEKITVDLDRRSHA